MVYITEYDEAKDDSNWSDLPVDIVELILKRLCLRDYLQFGLVCRYWNIIVVDAIATEQYLHAPQAQLPLMMASKDEVKVFSLTKRKLIHPKRPWLTKTQRCLGSIECWLVMFDYSLWSPMGDNVSIDPHSSPLFFLNTLSNVRVNLPSELTIPQQVDYDSCPFDKMVASSSPHCKDCYIAGLFLDMQQLAFCKLDDKSWTIIDVGVENMSFMDIEILQNKLYILIRQRGEMFIRAYDLQDPNTTVVAMFSIPAYHGVKFNTYTVDNISYVNHGKIYYLGKNAISRQLLLIQGCYDFSFDIGTRRIVGEACIIRNFVNPPLTKELRVWKYQESDSKWIEVYNLEDCSIFLGNRSLTVISISHLTRQELVERNSIYFAHWKNSSGSLPFKLEIGLFSLTDKSMKYFDPTDMSYFGLSKRYGMYFHWFIPGLP